MADSDIAVVNQALIKIGGAVITAFTDGTTEAKVASILYEDYVRGQQALVRWNWAKTQFSMNKLAAVPLEGWEYGYTIPADLLILHRVTYGDNDVPFARFKDKVFTNQNNDADDVVAQYTYRVDEIDWPADFTLAVVTGLSADFAMSLARDADLGKLLEDKATILFAKVRRNDAQGQTAKKMTLSRLTGSRLRSAGR
ncbi:MAG: hypothetical protein ABGY96_24345 [bacterium]|jgi:hypothetical protein